MSAPLLVDLTDASRLPEINQRQLSVGALEVKTERSLALLSPISLVILLPEAKSVKVTGRAVAPMSGGQGYFVQLDAGPSFEELREIAASTQPEPQPEPEPEPQPELEPEPQPQPEPEPEPEPESRVPSPDSDSDSDPDPDSDPATPTPISTLTPAWKLIDSTSTVPVHKQLKELGVADRVRLARQANRPVRVLLLRDMEKRIHLEVVKNPKVTDDEIVEATQITSLSPGALRWIATQRKFIRRKDVVMNLVFNPSTPSDQSMKLVATLNQSELLKVMRSNRVREKIQIAARRKLMKMGVL